MLTLRTSSPFDLFDRLEQQLHTAERVPAAEVHETADAYEVVLELPGVNKKAITVKATDRNLLVSAERPSSLERKATNVTKPEASDRTETGRGLLLSEFRPGTWSRSFRFPAEIDREHLVASYRDGMLSVTVPKARKLTTVSVNVED
ncbi:MAG TPA: heat-shock protein [Synechococcales bacterium UBA10510]|nr:heat-shock protein [Synechococcales bacterium UBA10510]